MATPHTTGVADRYLQANPTIDPRTDVLVDPMCGSGTICIEAGHDRHGHALLPA